MKMSDYTSRMNMVSLAVVVSVMNSLVVTPVATLWTLLGAVAKAVVVVVEVVILFLSCILNTYAKWII